MATSHTRDVEELAHSLTGFQRDMLAALRDADSVGGKANGTYGLAAKRTLEAWYGEDVNHGRLYPNLDELVDHGLVEKSQLDKRTNCYALTEDGEAVLDALGSRYSEGSADE